MSLTFFLKYLDKDILIHENDTYMSIGKRIAQFRKKLNMNQDKFAESLNISRARLAQWEIDRGTPDKKTLLKLYELGMNLNWLFTGNNSFQIDEYNELLQYIFNIFENTLNKYDLTVSPEAMLNIAISILSEVDKNHENIINISDYITSQVHYTTKLMSNRAL